MPFNQPRRSKNLRDPSELIPKSNPTKRISVPWSGDEQRAIAWLKTSAPKHLLSDRLMRARVSSAAIILKDLSGDELRKLVEMWKKRV